MNGTLYVATMAMTTPMPAVRYMAGVRWMRRPRDTWITNPSGHRQAAFEGSVERYPPSLHANASWSLASRVTRRTPR